MTALEYILDGLEAELALERELGVRFFECDRALVAATPEDVRRKEPAARPTPVVQAPRPRTDPPPGSFDLAFLHYKPLSEPAIEMMAKIILNLGYTAETAPVIVAPPVPKAKVYVILGCLALRKFLPGQNGAPGQWIRSPKGADVLVTYSPEYILRFTKVDASVENLKREMWKSLKSVTQRLRHA